MLEMWGGEIPCLDEAGRKMERNEMSYQIGKNRPPTGHNKRTIQRYMRGGEPFLSPKELIKIIHDYKAPYSPGLEPSRILKLTTRDKALASVLLVSCSRISEPLRIRKSQIDQEGDPQVVFIRNYMISKTKLRDKKGRPREPFYLAELPFTKVPGSILYPATQMFLDHLENVEKPKDLVFPIGTRRAEQIIGSMDPFLFPHYLRGCMLSHFINLIKNPLLVAKTFGIRASSTLERYYAKTWESAREEIIR